MIDAVIEQLIARAVTPLAEELRALRAAVEQLTAQQRGPELLPLCRILEISPRAALGRLSRDAELRGLGLRAGRRLLFRRAEVEALFAQRQRERSGLRAVGGQ